MQTINGYAIIAHRAYSHKPDEGLVILGVRKNNYNISGYEYVTAVVFTLDDKEWSWGHYLGTLDSAFDDYNKR